MIGLLVCFGGLLAAGLFFLAADLLRLPYLKTSKAMINTGRENRKAAKSLETYLLSLAVKLAPYIHMDEYKRGRQKNILKASGLNMEPEVYQAYVISKAGLVLLGVIPCLLVFPLLVVIVVVLAVAGLGAYSISKLEYKGRGFFNAYFFVAISLPGFLYIVPDYFIFNKLHLIDTRVGLMLVYIAMQIPFNMLLLKTFLAGIPRELEEAAKIDGCNELDSFMKITLPIAKPMFLTVAILVFVNVWNEYLWSNTFVTTEIIKPVATRFVKFTGEYGSDMAKIYTASVITIAPVIILYLLFSRKFIEGMTSGSVKG